ncbi:MAG: hypothetical protein U1F60_04025 [Planctomycetota bacterium]
MQTRTSLLAKSTSILGATVALLFASQSMAQVSYSFNFDANATGWTGNFTRFTGTTSCGGTGGAMRRNLYSGGTTGELISPLTGTSVAGNCTISFTYKVQKWNANTVAAPSPWGTIDVQYGSTATGPWTTFATFTNEAQVNNTCINKSFPFNPPAGALYIRWNCTRLAPVAPDTGDNYWNFDNVVISEVPVPCTTPAPGNTVGPADACPGANFTLSLQNATPGSVVSYQWYSSTVSGTGPWTPVGTNAPTFVTNQTTASWYYCDVTCSVGPVTTSSNVLAVPMSVATFPQTWGTGVVNPNCWSASALVGASLPDYNAVSAFGVGTGSVRYNFFSISGGNQPTLTSPTFSPLVGTNVVNFDVAGAAYTGGEVDQIALESSNDGGATWTTIVTMDNAVGGVLNTLGGTTGSGFVPTAAQWASLSYPVAAGTNRIRFRGISDFGNACFLDNVSFTAGLPASHTVVGTGCYDSLQSALLQEFAGSPAAKTALDGNSMVFVNVGSSYIAHWEAGGAVTYVAPTIGATTLSFGDPDDGEVTITPSLATPVPGGVTTDWTVSVNGILTAGAVANNLGDFTPTRGEIASATGLAFYTWRDFNAGELGSGPIQAEEVGNMLYITWNAVEAYGTPSPNPATFQFQVDMSTGHVRIVWVSFEGSTSTAPVIVGGTLAGASATPPSSDLTTATPYTMGNDTVAMTLSAVGAPINNGPAVNYTISNLPETFPGSGQYNPLLVFSFTASIPGGYDLDTIPFQFGIPGCNGYLGSFDAFVNFGNVGTSSFSFPIAWSVPGTPLQISMQALGSFLSGSLPNGQNPAGLVVSNALDLNIENF